MKQPHIDRFLAKVKAVEGKCWEWQACRDKDGYGVVWDGERNLKAHRVAYELANGEFNKALMVCHRCDNPPCCNPAHLFLGTLQQNLADRQAKCRQWHKLSDAQVVAIRAADGTQKEIARRFGIYFQTVAKIKSGRRRADVIA